MSGFLVIIVVGALFLWLTLVRPQRRQQQQQAALWEGLELGDEVVTAGGIYGEITALEGDDVFLRIAPELEVRVARRAIGGVVSRATDADTEDDIDAEPAAEPAANPDSPGADGPAEASAPEAGSYSEEPR